MTDGERTPAQRVFGALSDAHTRGALDDEEFDDAFAALRQMTRDLREMAKVIVSEHD